MRVAALFLALLAASTPVSSAQCMVKCFEYPSRPPCHQHAPASPSPSSQAACDSFMVAGEARSLRFAISPPSSSMFTGGETSVTATVLPAHALGAAKLRELSPPIPISAQRAVLRI